MLREDTVNGIVPRWSNTQGYRLKVEGHSPHKVEACLSLDGRGSGLAGFIRQVASSLLVRHTMWLAVSIQGESPEDSPFTVFEIDGVRETGTGKLIQDAPAREDMPHWATWDPTWEGGIALDPDSIVHVLLPDAYSSDRIARVVRDLAEVDWNEAGLIPSWVMGQGLGQRLDAPRFDAAEAERTRRLRVAQAALPIGWTAREVFLTPNTLTSEYYRAWRDLHFLHFRASLRERAEQALCEVLGIVNERCDFTVSVTAHGVYTPHEVNGFIQQFKAGEIALADVTDIQFERVAEGPAEPRHLV